MQTIDDITLKIITTRRAVVRSFGGQNRPTQIDGQITHCKYGTIDAYVRENVRIDTFADMNSGTRLRFLERGDFGQQVLELATIATGAQWDAIAAAVQRLDTTRRQVVRNRRWTVRAARAAMQRPQRGGRAC